MPLVLGGSAVVTPAYSVANSCRFNDADSPTLKKTLVSPTSAKKFTYSGWIKRGATGTGGSQSFFSTGLSGDSHYFDYRFDTDDTMRLNVNSAASDTIKTNAIYRDPSAWMHICGVVDTTDSTEADRIRLYVNGTRVTSFGEAGYPGQDDDIPTMVADDEVQIGLRLRSATQEFDGYLAEVCFIDGLALEPTSFGEFDSDSPTIWKPIDVSGLTFGNNGFWLDFEDSANLGNDANGGTDLTASNLDATDQATDTPTNNFCTLNPLNEQVWTYSEGNCQVANPASGWRTTYGTMGASTGKWYFEAECDAYGAGAYLGVIGSQDSSKGVDEIFKYYPTGYGYKGGDGTKANNAIGEAYGDTWTSGDIIGCAFDLTNGAIYWSKNGTWQASATTAEIAAGTTTNAAYTSIPSGVGYLYLPAIAGKASAVVWKMNFGGCPTYTISSGNTDSEGYGNFEYPPPTNFLSYCSKNIGGS